MVVYNGKYHKEIYGNMESHLDLKAAQGRVGWCCFSGFERCWKRDDGIHFMSIELDEAG